MIPTPSDGPPRPGWRRRELMRAALALTAGGLARPGVGFGQAEAEAGRLIVRNPRPLDAETPVEAFAAWRTPNDLFFVRSHFGPPAVALRDPWRLELGGLVERPAALTLSDLGRAEAADLAAVLQCSGNGRSFYNPGVPGVGWARGAVGNAEWGGVRLRDLLERAGLKAGAAHVHLLGADRPPNPKTPAFLRSIPLERAMDPRTLVATTMNGEPIPPLHGGPLRLVVPGWTGNHWIKWLRQITVAADEAPGFFMQAGYRMPKSPAPPGADLKPSDLVPVTTLNVKSLIARPSRDARLRPGRVEVRGVAWTGDAHVEKVEVSIDNGPWRPAQFEGPDRPDAWRSWRFDWDARDPGRHTIAARATDSRGAVQPEATPWNKSGYLWNGIDRVPCEVIG